MKISRKTFSIAIFCFYIAIMGIGIGVFPDAPIRQERSAYVGKLGTVHTAQKYHCFKIWERTFIITGSIVFFLAIGNVVRHYRTTGSFRRQ